LEKSFVAWGRARRIISKSICLNVLVLACPGGRCDDNIITRLVCHLAESHGIGVNIVSREVGVRFALALNSFARILGRIYRARILGDI